MRVVTADPIVRRHLEWMRLKNRRHLTIYARESALCRLSAWAQSPILYLSREQLVAFQVWRVKGEPPNEPISAATQRVEASHLRQFYAWAVREDLRADDPSDRLVIPKRQDYEARPLSDRVLEQAFQQAEPHMAAILGLARYAGLRACEVARLDWRDLRLGASEPILHVRDGKGGYPRTVHVSKALAELLLALPERTGPVIPRADGEPGYNTAPRISQRASKFLREEMGTEEGQTLHACRHGYATAGYQATLDIRATQEEMGHRTILTTQVYTKTANKARAEFAEAASVLRLDESA